MAFRHSYDSPECAFFTANGESKNVAPEKTGFAEISQRERGE
jgi:hypothetical protein